MAALKFVVISFVSAILVCAAPIKRALGKVKYGVVSIAGFDFGAGPSYCSNVNGNAYPPLVSNGVVSYDGPDGIAQMKYVNSTFRMNDD